MNGSAGRRFQTTDLVDAHVALISSARDRILTRDRDDLDALLSVRHLQALLVEV